MEFLRKGAQAASKLGNKILEAVEDQQSSGGFSGSSQPDLESDVGVRRAKVLTASLKSVGGRAQSWIVALKQQGAGAAACAQVALEAAKDEFGDDSQFTVAAKTLCDVVLEVDSKFTAQLCILLQRDIVDPILQELEQNGQIRAAIEEHRQGVPAGAERLSNILTRRRILLASALSALVGHQANYHARLGAQYAPLTPHVQLNKASLEKERSGAGGGSAAAGHPPPRNGLTPVVTASSPPRPTLTIPAKPAVRPNDGEEDLLGLNSPVEKQQSRGGEADLLGGMGDSPSAKRQDDNDLLGIRAGGGGGGAAIRPTPEADLLSGFLGTSQTSNSSQASGELGGGKKPGNDLLGDFAGPMTSSGGGGDFMDFMGGGSVPAVKKEGSLMDMFDPLSSNSNGGNRGVMHAHKQDNDAPAPAKRVAAAASAPAAGKFEGTGTDREALKQQFESHVQRKAEEAADLVRQQKAEKEEYDDMKWRLQDNVEKKIIAWAGPKHNRKNLRAMLSTFDSILFDEAKEKWKKVGLHEVVMAEQVKKIHRKAILLVHPDKVQRASAESKLVAEHIHAVLHEALEAFRKQENC